MLAWASRAWVRQYSIVGIVRDSTGTPLSGATVWLFRTSDEAFIAETTSAGDGSFMFPVASTSTEYFLRAHLDGAPRTFGTTDRTLVGA